MECYRVLSCASIGSLFNRIDLLIRINNNLLWVEVLRGGSRTAFLIWAEKVLFGRILGIWGKSWIHGTSTVMNLVLIYFLSLKVKIFLILIFGIIHITSLLLETLTVHAMLNWNGGHDLGVCKKLIFIQIYTFSLQLIQIFDFNFLNLQIYLIIFVLKLINLGIFSRVIWLLRTQNQIKIFRNQLILQWFLTQQGKHLEMKFTVNIKLIELKPLMI